MSTQIGITSSGIQEKCTIEHNCPRHVFHGKNNKDIKKYFTANSDTVVNSVDQAQASIPDTDAVNLDAYNMAAHECKMPSTAFRESFTCKECGKIYHSSLTGGEAAQFVWEEYTKEQQQKDAETCYCKPPRSFFKKNGTIWNCPKCGSQFELGEGRGEMGGRTWYEIS